MVNHPVDMPGSYLLTVAGPSGILTRFPILPIGAPEKIIIFSFVYHYIDKFDYVKSTCGYSPGDRSVYPCLAQILDKGCYLPLT